MHPVFAELIACAATAMPAEALRRTACLVVRVAL